MDIEELKEFIKVDEDCDPRTQQTIEGLKGAAEEHLLGAGVEKDYSIECYKLAVKFVVDFWYNGDSKTDEFPLSIISLINQLRYNAT